MNGGVTEVVLPASKIWTPDVLLYNRFQLSVNFQLIFSRFTNSVCLIGVFFSQQVCYLVAVISELKNFPNDFFCIVCLDFEGFELR